METHHMDYHTRSYQQEMFERSMEGNTIVVMDTGSGKTQVAILRIQAELDRCSTDKRVWFLAPTVELCIQQHRVLKTALPAYSHRLLTGSENVDRWSEQRIWDAALDQHRIIVSTHAVLADALRHGFVHISDLALIVFDEAHHCVKKHPANTIMKDFYHPAKSSPMPSSVPCILGLSASLIMRSNLQSMKTIESNLDSISVTPRIHRQDLLLYVHRPSCQLLQFDAYENQTVSKSLTELKSLRDSTTLSCEMYKHNLKTTTNSPNITHSFGAAEIQATHAAVHAFCRKAEVIYESLGSWAVDYFVNHTIQMLEKSDTGVQNVFDAQGTSRQNLLTLFIHFQLQALCQDHLDLGDSNISPKVKCLLSFLVEKDAEEPVGIVFVEQRATTSVLSALLQRHPVTKGRFSCVPFVGTSSAPSRRYRLTELVDLKAQKETLGKFRTGEHNLIVATNALEEGIDVQSCNLVVCFDPPASIKSFIQRRGRARHVRSRLAILVSATGDRGMIDRWQSLEDELSRICQSDRVRMLCAREAENRNEEIEYELVVSSTGAKLTADATLQHLHHFCNQLPHRAFVDFRPQFSYEEDGLGMIEATVVLPNCVSAQVRRATSQKRWRTECAARKDAAFQAYSALYRAGLLNDNLLPLCQSWNLGPDDLEDVEVGLTDIAPQIHIWSEVSVARTSLEWHETVLTVLTPDALRSDDEMNVKVLLITPLQLGPIPPLLLYWAPGYTFTIDFSESMSAPRLDSNEISAFRQTTLLFYSAVRSKRLACRNMDFVTLFAPCLKDEGWEDWLQKNSQSIRASSVFGTSIKSLIRVPYPNNPAYIFRAWSDSEKGDVVLCERLPRRRNFLLSTGTNASEPLPESSLIRREPRLDTFPAQECAFDSLPVPFARVGLFMPAILQHIEDCTIADRLQSGLLKNVRFRSREHIITALCAPSAERQRNYQRFEFLGDSVLKFVVACHLFVSQPDWHEGFLSMKRSQLVSNTTLAGAAVRANLPPYIITENISLKDWTVPVFPSAQHAHERRQVSSKILADVVEALIGATWTDSGMGSARKCINIFLPGIPAIQSTFETPKTPIDFNFQIANTIESLIGYTFNNPRLLREALTHPSCGGCSPTDSYQRLEYLGDAVLDLLIAEYMAARLDRLSQGRMTQVKAALVNARLLGFLCLDLRRSETHRAVQTDDMGRTTETSGTRESHLATYMLAASFELAAAQQATQERYDLHQNDIRQKLLSGKQYPWVELLRLRPEKFFSDLIESTLGAIFIDAAGSLQPCKAFIERLRLEAYMDRMIADGYDVLHPRERVQRWTGARNVTYNVQRNEADGRFRCSFSLDGINITGVEDCCDREEAIARVASQAEGILASESTKESGI